LGAIALLMLVACVPLAGAEMTVKQYHKDSHSRNEYIAGGVKMYVMGVGQGIGWANVAAAKNNAPLYCQPSNFAINANNYIDILNKMIDTFSTTTTAKELDEFPIGMLLLMGLQQTFPCRAEK
jgi:hypothetical protein